MKHPQIPSHKVKIQVIGRKICLNDEIKNNLMTNQFQIALVIFHLDPEMIGSYLV